MTPVIVEAAINGVTQKARNPHVPRAPEEIAADGLRCIAAGAAIVHNHLDEFSLDGPSAAERYLAGWRPILAERPDAIVYPTVGFGGSVEARYDHIDRLAGSGLMRMGLLDPGSVNLGGLGEDGLPGGIDFIYANTFGDIRYVAGLCDRHRLGPSIAIFEPGFLRTTLAYHRAGRLPKGAFVKLYFGGDHDYLAGRRGGATFGLPPTRPALEAYLDLLEGSGLTWAVAVIGGDVTENGFAALALSRGGHVRVGLEDYAGSRTPSNEELVREVAAIAASVDRPVATCADAARILGLSR